MRFGEEHVTWTSSIDLPISRVAALLVCGMSLMDLPRLRIWFPLIEMSGLHLSFAEMKPDFAQAFGILLISPYRDIQVFSPSILLKN